MKIIKQPSVKSYRSKQIDKFLDKYFPRIKVPSIVVKKEEPKPIAVQVPIKGKAGW